jgi:Domain of unknown function (DUF4202)
MGNRPGGGLPAPVASGDDAVIDRALSWIEPYWNAEHLRRTDHWLRVLDPDAHAALRLAALTHDMERHFPGGPVEDLSNPPEANLGYRREHAERSARIVGEWLRGEGGGEALVREVERLVRLHEVGGDPDADLLQAADSISFLEVNVDLPGRWVAEGRCDLARGLDQHRWMFERIRLERARPLARPFLDRTIARAA